VKVREESLGPRLLATLLVVTATSCDGCRDEEPASNPADLAASSMPLVEPWVMGAAKDDVALPPPCRLRDDPLTAVLGRDSRLTSEPHSLGRILVAEGANHTVGEKRPAHPALALKRWEPDASGLMAMRHGPTGVTPIPWPATKPPILARAGDRWLALLERADTPRASLWLWREGQAERLGDADALGPASLRCLGESCAILTRPVDATGTPTGTDGASLWLGKANGSVHGWQRHPIDVKGASPFGMTGLTTTDGEVTVHATLVDDLRARVVEVTAEGSRVVVTPLAPHGVVATTLAAEPVVVGFAGPRGPRRCDAAGGGVLVTVGNREAVHLRSALVAERGDVHAIEGGALVTWLAPARCDGPRRVLHATIVDDEGQPMAPVTVVGEAEDYAVATKGSDVDLWLRRSGGVTGPSDMGTVTYLRARCDLGS
jgi:hypothetical protein